MLRRAGHYEGMSTTEKLVCIALSLAAVVVLTYFFGHDLFSAVQSELAKRLP